MTGAGGRWEVCEVLVLFPAGPVDAWTEPISKEAEEQANTFFQAVYHGNMTVDQLLHTLKQFRGSANKRERVRIAVAMVTVCMYTCDCHPRSLMPVPYAVPPPVP